MDLSRVSLSLYIKIQLLF